MRCEELLPHGKQVRVQNLLYAGQIDFSILGERMVAMHYQRDRSQREQEA